jgi:hypothetical protein
MVVDIKRSTISRNKIVRSLSVAEMYQKTAQEYFMIHEEILLLWPNTNPLHTAAQSAIAMIPEEM